jgi:hypothetical protein
LLLLLKCISIFLLLFIYKRVIKIIKLFEN